MRVLFITHNTHRAGAPIVLLQFLKWIKQNKPAVKISLLDLNEGVLKKEFAELCHEYISLNGLEKTNTSYVSKGLKRLTKKKNKITKEELIEQLNLKPFDLIYANTIKAIPYGVLIKAKNTNTKLLAHIHELPTVIKLLLTDFNKYLQEIDHFIAVSNLVLEKLHENWEIPLDKLSKVYAFAVINKIPSKNLQRTRFHIGASGLVDWRKGYDVFIQVARHLKKYHPELDLEFTWVGSISNTNRIIIEEDVLKLGLNKSVSFVGELANPFDVYNTFDVFLMCSREDPFPLVSIEVAMLNKPIICFEKATGTAEIIKKGGGKIVSYLDIEAMANEVMTYKKNPEQRISDGMTASELFSEFTPELICPKLFNVIQEQSINLL